MPDKPILFSVTKDDLEIEYYSGTGAGGQNRNHNMMACRIHHRPSGAMASCQEERSQKVNRERALKRLVESDKFQKWLKLEAARRMGKLADLDALVERQMKNVRIEVHDEKGRWVEVTDDYFREDTD